MARIENIETLTAEAFSDVLRKNWCKQDRNTNEKDDSVAPDVVNDRDTGPKINAISATKVDQGVLSDVYRVHLDYAACGNQVEEQQEQGCKEDGITKSLDTSQIDVEHVPMVAMPPVDWLVKFCRSDLDLSWMIRNETIFYSRIAPEIIANATAESDANHGSSPSRSLPFTIPKFLNGSDKHIIIQEVTNIKTYPLAEGCPPDKIDFLLKALVAWHASCWESKTLLSHSSPTNYGGKAVGEDRLVFPMGMGQRLPPLQKEGLFISSWQETINHLRCQDNQRDKLLDTELLDFITKLCRRLSTLKLRDIHEKVHSHRVTCVHGDYHISNWLFPMTTIAEEEERKPVLVDFATTGYGNPMIDLVFFIVVSTNDETVSDSQLFLEKYYRLLIEFDPNLSSKISLATLKEWFQWAVLCQFMILVAYDGICRNIAEAEQDKQKRESQIRHFYNVNRRMILAIRSIGNWDTILSTLEMTTFHEQQEARIFCQNTALVI
mmetsp:Transcript_27578/g.60716  ORF Transcript_27578/g.60716 Transcript_27578/m.60716 type:complete len:492 (-) Transcript_27578:3422-4897(-)